MNVGHLKNAFRMLLILLVVCLTVTGCNQAQDKPLWAVENQGDPAPPIWLAIAAEKSKIKSGEELLLTLYYEPMADYGTIFNPAPIRVKCNITMNGGDYDKERNIEDDIVIREIENFSKEQYVNHYHNGVCYESAAEDIVIPADQFAYEKGYFVWGVTMELIFSDKSPKYESSAISLYYIKKGDTILLFGDYYSFKNYK